MHLQFLQVIMMVLIWERVLHEVQKDKDQGMLISLDVF